MESAKAHALPWTLRAAAAVRIPVWRAALGAVVLVLLLDLVVLNVLGVYQGLELAGAPFWRHPLGQFEAFFPFAIGYFIVLTAQVLQAPRHQLHALAPVLDRPPAELEGRLYDVSPRTLLVATVAGTALVVLGDAATVGAMDPSRRPEAWRSWVAFSMSRDALVTALLVPAFWSMAAICRRFSGIVEDHARVDLLDLGPLRPAARLGLRLALVIIVGASLGFVSMLPVLDDFGAEGFWVTLCMGVGGPVTLAALVLALPLQGARRAIRRQKAAELVRVRARIDDARAATLAGDHAASGDLPGLLAYEGRVEDVREWPLDLPALARFGLYALIPLASWIAAAFVERALDAALR